MVQDHDHVPQMKDDKVDNKAVDKYVGKMVPEGFLPVVQVYLNQCHSSGKYMTQRLLLSTDMSFD